MTADQSPAITATIAEVAQSAYQAAQSASLPVGSPNSRAQVRAVACGVVDSLVDAATHAAQMTLAPASTQAALAVWDDVLDRLAEHWLTDVIYCTRTGRRLYQVDPADWLDYLALVARLEPSDPLRTSTIDRIVAAIVAQKSAAIGPVVLDISGPGLTLSRLVDMRDFCLISIAKFFPASRPSGSSSIAAGAIKSDMTEAAQRGEILAQCRELMADLPRPVLAYAAECLSLYLSNINPAKLPPGMAPLDHYHADWLAPWRSTATVAHLCGRLVQSMVAEISRLRLRPLDKLTKADLRALRVAYSGSDAYSGIRAKSSAWRASLKASEVKPLSSRAAQRVAIMSADPDLAALLDTLDLQTAIAATGRQVGVDLSRPDANIAISRRDAAAKLRREEADNLIGDDMLDLSSLLVNGTLPAEFLPAINDEADLVEAGLFTEAELKSLDFDLFGADDDDDANDEDDTDADLIAEILGALDTPDLDNVTRKTIRAPLAKPATPATPATLDDMTVAALTDALGDVFLVPSTPHAAPAPIKRRVVKSAPVMPDATPAPAPAPAPAPIAPRVIQRRVIR